ALRPVRRLVRLVVPRAGRDRKRDLRPDSFWAQGRSGAADKRNMAFYNFARHRPGRVIPVLFFSILTSVALGLFIGDTLVPAMIQLGAGR
ncbi:MAG TPA: hypothetical protein PKJ41_06105, partial [Bryobacteraceae bacterium]|nr:hypothetical protein [Bryobacteraceae bacterium]